MAGLFGVESPEDIRARIGATGRQEDLQLASLPAGRGIVALNSQLGRGIAQGAGKLLGGTSEADQKAEANQQIGLKIDALAKEQGVTRKDNPIEYSSLAAQVLLEGGETQAASNALKMSNTLKTISTVPTDTALTQEVMSIFGLKNKSEINKTPKAKALMEMAVIAKNNRQSTIPQPSNTTPTAAEINLTAKAVSDSLEDTNIVRGGESFDASDFADGHLLAYSTAVAGEVKRIQADNKQHKKAPLNPTQVLQEAKDNLEPFLKKRPVDGVTGYLGNDELFFDSKGFSSTKHVDTSVIDFNAL